MSDPQLGQLLALLSAVSFAFGGVFISRGARLGGDKGVLFSVLVTMIFSFALWITLEGGSLGQAEPGGRWRGIAWFALAGILAMVLGRTLLYTSIQRLGVTRAGSVKRLNPFFSVLCAYLFLSEPITGWDGTGMAIIAAAFGLLIYRSTARSDSGPRDTHLAPVLYLWGVGSALAYSFAYVGRKNGLAEIDAPVFGTMISAVSGFAFFLIAAAFHPTHRNNLRRIFSNLNPWLFFAAIFVSCGQILQFAALFYEKVSTVVMINSLEIFIGSFLAVVVFRTERRPDAGTYIAAVLATVGVLAVTFG